MLKIRILYVYFFLFSLNIQGQNVALNSFVKSTNLKHAGIGINVIELESGKTICKYNEHLALTPASTMKVLTTASALEIFGKDYTYETKVYAVGNINQSGVLDGFLFIKGSGDPTLGSQYLYESDKKSFLTDWLHAIQSAGIKEITEGVKVEQEPDCYEACSQRWILEDVGNYYAPEIHSVNVFDNSYLLYFKTGAEGTTPDIIKTEPKVNIIFRNYLNTVSRNAGDAYIRGFPRSQEKFLYGSLNANRNNISIKGSIPNPPSFLAEYFSNYLIENGIKIGGKSGGTQYSASEEDMILTKTTSKPLSEIIKLTNFKSNNHYAEALSYSIGREKTEVDACTFIPEQSISFISDFWKRKGIDSSGLAIYDGSGLSPSNALSADFLTSILTYMYNESEYADTFYASLPEAGKEGTVQNFLKAKRKNVSAHIKSGSIRGVQSYTGYIQKKNKHYAFAIIVNNFTGTRAALRSQIETFLLNF